MVSETRKSYRIHIFCSILVIAFLVCIPVITAWTTAKAEKTGAGTEISADPLGRLPSSPEEAHKRAQERSVGWPEVPAGEGRDADSVRSGVRVSIPYDTVSGRTFNNNSAVRIELVRAAVVINTINKTTNATGVFTADISTEGDNPDDIQSGDTIRVTDLVSGPAVDVVCTLTGTVNTGTDVVSGASAVATSVDVYICTPSTILGDVPPGSAHKASSGPAWTTDFTDVLNVRDGDTAFFYATDANANVVMNVARTTPSLVVYPQYDDVLGFGPVSTALTVNAGTASQNVGSAKDGFFEAWFTNHNIVPGEQVSCAALGSRAITVADVTAICDPSTNRVSGKGPANRTIRITMNPYGGAAVVYQASTNAQGNFDVDLGGRFTARGSEVYNVAWYDSDSDAVVYEFQSYSWHLAEGYTGVTPNGGGFDTYILIQNPGTATADVTMSFQVQGGSAAPRSMSLPGKTRTTVHLDELPGLADASVATTVTSTNGATINAERSMYFNYQGLLGGHDSIGTLSPTTEWYLSEGYTGVTPGGGWFHTWVTVQNPGTTAANVTMEFQLDVGAAPDLDFNLPAGGRMSFLLNDLPGLSGVSVSTKVTSDQPVVVERPVYFNYEGKTGGHESIGVSLPRKTWYLAEGYTGTTPGGGSFDTWVTLQNPGATDATVTLEFQVQNGTAPDYTFNLPAGTREQVHLDELPQLADASVSTKITSNVDVIAERPVYFNYEGKKGGHDSKGAELASRGWYLPEGYTGMSSGGQFDTWVTVQNPGTTDATVTFEFQVENGSAPNYDFALAAGTRQSIHLNELPGLSAGVSVSTKVSSNVPVVCERPEYFGYGAMDGGSNSVGIPFAP